MSYVLVTGASGFIAKHIVRELLAGGHQVRASVRSDARKQQLAALFGADALDFVELDLTSDKGWDDAVKGVDVVIHTASPFPADSPRDPEVLIRPAVDGTLRAMNAAQRAGVKRVILTSSCAAIYKDSAKPRMQRSTPANWTDPKGKDTSPYEASKTLAEKAAWDFVAQHPEMQLTTICPGGVVGPPMDEHYGTSLDLVKQILDGKFPLVPQIDLPIVDVRDVARMHVDAIDNAATIGSRFVGNAGAMTIKQMAEVLKAQYPSRKISTRELPNWVVRAGAPFHSLMRQVAGNLNRTSDVDASATEQVMGFTFIPSADALRTSAEWIVDHESSSKSR